MWPLGAFTARGAPLLLAATLNTIMHLKSKSHTRQLSHRRTNQATSAFSRSDFVSFSSAETKSARWRSRARGWRSRLSWAFTGQFAVHQGYSYLLYISKYFFGFSNMLSQPSLLETHFSLNSSFDSFQRRSGSSFALFLHLKSK